MAELTKDEKILFAISKAGQGDGIPVVLLGVPVGAWNYMRNGKTHTFDLTKVGLPVKLILYGATDHAEALACIKDFLTEAGEVIDDRIDKEDFSIQPRKEKP